MQLWCLVCNTTAFQDAQSRCDEQLFSVLSHMLFREARSGAEGEKTLGRMCLLVVSKWRPHNMIGRLSFPHRLFLPARVHRDVFHGVEQAVMAGEA